MANRISDLPEVIIQHIQSFLETKQVAPTILVSKSWLRAWSTSPFLDFTYRYILYGDSRLIVSQGIDHTLERYVEQGISVLKLRLHLDTIEERWLQLVRKTSVIELDICTPYGRSLSTEHWQEILLTKSLQVLRVVSRDCQLVHRDFSREYRLVLSDIDIKCVNLKKLELHWMQIDYVTFHHIMSSCPLIEEFSLRGCRLFDISASNPEIESLLMFEGEWSSLKRLSLVNTKFDAEQLQTILSKTPRLEYLKMAHFYERDKENLINLSSLSLKHLNIKSSNVRVVLIDAPNLRKLKFDSDGGPEFPITIMSPITEGSVDVTINYSYWAMYESWFDGLTEFLSKFAKTSVNFTSSHSPFLSFDLKVFKATPLPRWHEVESLWFKLGRWSINLPLLYAFFTICHPKKLLLGPMGIISRRKRASLRKLFEELSNKGDIECCKLNGNKCWRHYIKEVKLLVDGKQKPLDINELITGSENRGSITLALKW